jgi:hypothetical protein
MRTTKYIFICMLLFSVSVFAKGKVPAAPTDKSAECLACHSDVSLAKEVDGKVVSLHVD